jgi:hypothetical protein
MALLLRLCAALLLDLVAGDCCIPLTPNGTETGACGPPCATPSWLFDPRHSLHACTGGHPFDGLHPLGWTGGGPRLPEDVPRLLLRAHRQAKHRRPLGAGPTHLCEPRIAMGVKHDASRWRRTDQMRHPDGDMGALMAIVAHTSDHNCSKQAKQASGNLTPRD